MRGDERDFVRPQLDRFDGADVGRRLRLVRPGDFGPAGDVSGRWSIAREPRHGRDVTVRERADHESWSQSREAGTVSGPGSSRCHA